MRLSEGVALIVSWHQVIFPKPHGLSIVTLFTFHNQVRDGLAWFHENKDTKTNKQINFICLFVCVDQNHSVY